MELAGLRVLWTQVGQRMRTRSFPSALPVMMGGGEIIFFYIAELALPAALPFALPMKLGRGAHCVYCTCCACCCAHIKRNWCRCCILYSQHLFFMCMVVLIETPKDFNHWLSILEEILRENVYFRCLSQFNRHSLHTNCWWKEVQYLGNLGSIVVHL